MKIRVIDIGNSKGIRLSKTLIHQYNIMDEVEVELKKDCIQLKSVSSVREGWEAQFKKAVSKLSKADKDLMDVSNKFDEEEWTWK